jgi:hypothetical protein
MEAAEVSKVAEKVWRLSAEGGSGDFLRTMQHAESFGNGFAGRQGQGADVTALCFLALRI